MLPVDYDEPKEPSKLLAFAVELQLSDTVVYIGMIVNKALKLIVAQNFETKEEAAITFQEATGGSGIEVMCEEHEGGPIVINWIDEVQNLPFELQMLGDSMVYAELEAAEEVGRNSKVDVVDDNLPDTEEGIAKSDEEFGEPGSEEGGRGR